MKKRIIFSNQSQELLRLFEEARSGEKVMCVPIDYAKKDHMAMFCNGHGRILRKPFCVKNSPESFDTLSDLLTQVEKLNISRRVYPWKEVDRQAKDNRPPACPGSRKPQDL